MVRCFNRHFVVAVVLGIVAFASASDVGRYIADQVDAARYQYFMEELLYTHLGDNRSWGRPDHDAARDNILATFQSYGLDAEFHEYTNEVGTGHNVVGTLWGSVYPGAQYIVGAHYDSAHNPGADDDASGVAGLLELARVLSQYETEYTVKLIAFDMEELGLRGSGRYVQEHLDDDIRAMVQLDMISHMGFDYATRIYAWHADELQAALAAAVEEYGHGLSVRVFGKFGASDHFPFSSAGFDACLMIEDALGDGGGNPCYHRPCDSVDTPDYIFYDYAADQVRSVAGFLADHAGVIVDACPGDLDGDVDTDQADLGILLASFGIDDGGDLDGDGVTDQADLGILLADWGCTR